MKPINKHKYIFLFALVSLGLHANADSNDLKKAMSLDNFDEIELFKPQFDELKLWGVRVGMYYGYQSELKEIDKDLQELAESLDKAFNFRNLIIEDNLLPPVIVKGYNFYKQDNGVTTESSEIYRIRKKARYSYNSPTWRDYLLLSSGKISKPILSPGIKPKTQEAKDAWRAAVEDGYEKGIEHAREVFQYKMSELKEDFQGMVLAHHLYQLGMLDVSKLVKLAKGTVVSDDGININEVITQLEGNDKFKPLENWKPMIHVNSAGGAK